MCVISDKLILCTCKAEDVKRLKHYWVLKRPTEKVLFLVGEMILPANIGEDAHQLNQKIISTQLNIGNCFDTEIQHQEGDVLELHFTINVDKAKYINLPCNGNYLAYAFKFKKGKWKKEAYDPFGQHFQEVQNGKIIKAFSRDLNHEVR